MIFHGIKRVKVELRESEIMEKRIHFDQDTIKYLNFPTQLSLIEIEGEPISQGFRPDNHGHGCRTGKLLFIEQNYEYLLNVNRGIEIEKISENPFVIKFHLVK